jgi:orotidine-5'-phosphate decarboxylase
MILALDVDNLGKAKYFVNKLLPQIKIFKVGFQLFTAAGPKIIKFIHRKQAGVFLDLKFFDIPNTVAHAVQEAVRLRVKMLTLHIGGGEEMLRQAVKAAQEESRSLKVKPPLLIGVTVLTSQEGRSGHVLSLARLGLSCGLDGVVCSVREAAMLRRAIKRRFVLVTPGIRPKGSAKDDQKRVATAQEAMKAGANFIVVGRPILEASDPLKAAEAIIRELS